MDQNVSARKRGIKIILFILIILWCHCFYLFPYKGIFSILDTNTYLYFLGFISVGLALLCLLFLGNDLNQYSKWIFWYLAISLISYLMLVTYSQFTYPLQPLRSTLHLASKFLIPFLSVPILVIFTRQNGPNRFFSFLNVITFIWYVILILQTIHFRTSYSFLFDFNTYFTNGVTFRENSLRIDLGAFGNIMILYNFFRLYSNISSKKVRVLSFIQIVLGIYCLIFIQQTRAYTIVVFLGIVLLILFGSNTWKSKLFSVIVILAALYFILVRNFVSNFIDSFYATSQYSISTTTRFYELSYYWNCFLENPIFGNGLSSENYYYSIEHGSLGMAYYSDIGYIGLLAQSGLMSIIFYLVPLFRMIKITYLYLKNRVLNNNLFVLIALVYIIGTSMTLLVLDDVRVMLFSIIIAYFEYKFSALGLSTHSERQIKKEF